MIADQHMQPPAGRCRLGLEAHQEIHGFARTRAAVENVADDDQVCLAGAPGKRAVDHLGRLQGAYQGIVVAMNVADRDDPLDAIECPFRCRLGTERQEQQDCCQKRSNNRFHDHRLHGPQGPSSVVAATPGGNSVHLALC